jgi:long-chain acyl-CoA synthetase
MAVLVTGVTGFLGADVARRLLANGEEVLGLVRAPDAVAARERLDRTFAERYELPAEQSERLHALPGDVTLPGLGLGEVAMRRLEREVTRVVHAAASVSFDTPVLDALRTNTLGTKHVLDVARRLTTHGVLEHMVHVSTAYVAGRSTGRFTEGQLVEGQSFRNGYERAKYEAEVLVAAATDVPCAVVRPSIIVGDSTTGWTPSFNVIYGPLRALDRGLIGSVPLELSSPVDVVPLDYVSEGIVRLLDSSVPGERYHLVAGDDAVTSGELLQLACQVLRRARPLVTTPGDDPGDGALAAYAPYFDIRVRFDDANARRALDTGCEPPLLHAYFSRLMRYARAARWGRDSVSLPQASRAAEEVAA